MKTNRPLMARERKAKTIEHLTRAIGRVLYLDKVFPWFKLPEWEEKYDGQKQEDTSPDGRRDTGARAGALRAGHIEQHRLSEDSV